MGVVRNGPLEPGSYQNHMGADGHGFSIRFTVPAGWTWNGSSLSKGGIDVPDGAAIFLFNGQVGVYADPCHWAASPLTPPTGPTSDKVVAALAAQPSRHATTPIDRFANSGGAVDIWTGKTVELTVPADIDFAECDGGQYRSWGPDDKARSHQGPGQRDLVWAVDTGDNGVDGAGLFIIDAASFQGTPPDVMSEIDSILESIVAGHWG
jgi:hypothetical protein